MTVVEVVVDQDDSAPGLLESEDLRKIPDDEGHVTETMIDGERGA